VPKVKQIGTFMLPFNLLYYLNVNKMTRKCTRHLPDPGRAVKLIRRL